MDALASITFGPIIRYTGRVPVFIFGALLHIGLVIWLLLWRPNPDESIIFFVIGEYLMFYVRVALVFDQFDVL